MSNPNKKMTKGRLTFICVWLAIFAVSFLVWALYLGAVTRSLVKYDEYAPQFTAEKIFDTYFRNAGGELIVSYDGLTMSPYDSHDAASRYVDRLISAGALEYGEKEISEDKAVYTVTADGIPLAEFSIKPDPRSKAIYGRRAWMLDRIALLIEPECSAQIIAPKDSVVKVNGIVLNSSNLFGDPITLEDAVYFPADDPDARIMVTYRIEGLFDDPDITVESADGKVSFGMEFDKNGSVYDTEYSYRTHLSDIYNQKIFGDR